MLFTDLRPFSRKAEENTGGSKRARKIACV